MIINMNGGTSGLSPNSAVLHVTAISGSTVSLFKNNILIKSIEPEKSHPDVYDTDISNYYFSIFPTNYGEYRVMAEMNEMNMSQNITINSNKQYDLSLLFNKVYLIRNGVPSDQLEIGGDGSAIERTGCYHLIAEANQSSFITQYIGSNFKYLNYLTLELVRSEEGEYGKSWRIASIPELGYCLAYPDMRDDQIWNISESVALTQSIGVITNNKFVLNMQQTHDSKYVFVSVGAPTSTEEGYLNISNLYLSSSLS